MGPYWSICPVLPCPVVLCPALPCPALPCPALLCPALYVITSMYVTLSLLIAVVVSVQYQS